MLGFRSLSLVTLLKASCAVCLRWLFVSFYRQPWLSLPLFLLHPSSLLRLCLFPTVSLELVVTLAAVTRFLLLLPSPLPVTNLSSSMTKSPPGMTTGRSFLLDLISTLRPAEGVSQLFKRADHADDMGAGLS